MKAFAVYGPPGCGKTTEMLRRIEEAKKTHDPDKIGFLSFTKAGAAEALKRLGLSRSDRVSTIHSLTFKLGGWTRVSVIDNAKRKAFGDKTGYRFKNFANDTGEQMEIGDQYLAVLSLARARRRELVDQYYDSDRPGSFQEFESFCKSYEAWKDANGYVDFDDMLEQYLHRPVNHGATALFVDEAQDLSDLQWAVIDKMLEFKQVREVHIAGDDDQAIFEWSGANTHGMAEFEERYKAQRATLDQSWRVPQAVHQLAEGLIKRIPNRVDKVYKPRDHAGLVKHSSWFTKNSVKHGEDTLVLCRNFVTRKEVETELIRHRIPYKSEGGYPSLFSTRVADAIRVFKKLEHGEHISTAEIAKMEAVADDRTRRDLQLLEFKPMLKRGYMRSFIIPAMHVDFYREADLEQEPTIRLSTIHSAKGREADRVVLHTGLTTKTINDMHRDTSAMDAEVRVWYVGVTRAKQELEIVEGDQGFDL